MARLLTMMMLMHAEGRFLETSMECGATNPASQLMIDKQLLEQHPQAMSMIVRHTAIPCFVLQSAPHHSRPNSSTFVHVLSKEGRFSFGHTTGRYSHQVLPALAYPASPESGPRRADAMSLRACVTYLNLSSVCSRSHV